MNSVEISSHSKPNFKNLDGIRFIAFLGVFFSHTFYSTNTANTQSTLYQAANFLASPWGDIGLSVFFVMSGFLITYLLMSERQVTGRVHVLSFYARRILRIWPLYFVMVAFNFFVYASITGHHELVNRQLPFYFFYANMDVIYHGFSNGIIDPLWAISVEEQFYLLLPLVMLLVPNKKLGFIFISTVIASQIFRIVHYSEAPVIFFHSISAAFEIALGGLAAWLMFFDTKAKTFVASISSSAIAVIYGLFTMLILFQNYLYPPSQLVVLVLIAQLYALFIILEQSYSTNSFIKIGRVKWVSFLGKYSYGFFCYHILCIRLVEAIVLKVGATDVVTKALLVPISGLVLTILVGIVSYHAFEIHFLKLKKKFSYLN